MAAWPKLKWDSEPTGPLKGIKVVDMATVVLGPFATVNLADLGAEVIKIENSEGNTPGDLMRYGGDSPTKQHGPIYTALNRNKKAINLNIKKPDDKAVLEALLEDADVFIHNVRMAGMERLGFGYDAVKAINPDIVYVHCAGYGADGAYAPSLVADKVSGLFAANATMAALLARANGAGGQFVQVPMFECFTWFNMVENLFGETFIPGDGKMGYTRSVNPRRRPYPTSDGYIAIVPYNDRQWAKFFELGGRPNVFEDPRFSTYQERTKHTGELYALIEEVTAERTTAEWLDLLAEHDIPAMKYNRMADILVDPHLADVGFFEEHESPDIGKYRSMKHPVHYAGTPASIYADPPMLDADGDEIKKALGM